MQTNAATSSDFKQTLDTLQDTFGEALVPYMRTQGMGYADMVL